MNPYNMLFILIVIIHLNSVFCMFGFESYVVGGIAALGAALYKNFDRYIGCSYTECCSTMTGAGKWISLDVHGLSTSLKNQLHGQHLVRNIVISAIKSHFTNRQPSKALVLSFHGWTGGGKNFVSSIIAQNLFKNGMKSKFVHLFISTVHFPHEDKADIYKLQLQDWIRGNVSSCENSLFIFDEIDKMPHKTIDGIKPFIDYHESIFGVDFRKSVFIFLSNTGSRDINAEMLKKWRAGQERESLTYADIEELIQKGAFNEKGGLHQSDLIQHSLIDFYVPFLPLERRHVQLCIKDEVAMRNLKQTPEFNKKVMDKLMFFPPESQLFSTKGCKSISTIVGFLLTEVYVEDMFT